jgi:hypothetical protein
VDPVVGGDVGVSVCGLDVVADPAVVLWVLGCVSVDEAAMDPDAEALPLLGVERWVRARDPMTAIPAKPPVAVTLRASERRRWEWRPRLPYRVLPAESLSWKNSDSAEVVPPKSTELGAACARARALARLRSAAVPAAAVVGAPWFAGVGRGSCPPPTGWCIQTTEVEFCALGIESALAPHPGQERTPLSSLWHEVQ